MVSNRRMRDSTYPLAVSAVQHASSLYSRHVVTSEEKTSAEETSCDASGRGYRSGSDEWFSRGKSEKANEPTHLVEVVQVADVALSRDHGERGGERGGAQGHAHDGHLAKYVRRRQESAMRESDWASAARAFTPSFGIGWSVIGLGSTCRDLRQCSMLTWR